MEATRRLSTRDNRTRADGPRMTDDAPRRVDEPDNGAGDGRDGDVRVGQPPGTSEPTKPKRPYAAL
jgi:hypothetical protein